MSKWHFEIGSLAFWELVICKVRFLKALLSNPQQPDEVVCEIGRQAEFHDAEEEVEAPAPLVIVRFHCSHFHL